LKLSIKHLIPALLALFVAPGDAPAQGSASTSSPRAQAAAPSQARPTTPSVSSSTRRQKRQRPARGIYGERLGPGGSGMGALGGAASSGSGPFATAAPTGTPGIWHITFDDPGTGWKERFLLAVPAVPLTPAPLLVMFHGYSATEWDSYYNTPIMKDAMKRGWYVAAPLGAHNVNYGITYAQANIEVVLDWIDQLFWVDHDRVYGLGFSMGGGAAASYAARHLDPDHLRFAALVNHTGSTSLSHTYWSVTNHDLFDMPEMFGGSPTLYPFEYARCSVMDLALDGVTVDPATDMAHNLAHIPTLDVVASNEPSATYYLRTQTLALHDWLGILGGIETLLEPIAFEHVWGTLDSQTALNFLESHTLAVPGEGMHTLLADRDGAWHHFQVFQHQAGEFTPFRFSMSEALNQIVIDQTDNLQRLVIDTDSIGLDTSLLLKVILGSQSGQMQTITVPGYPVSPSQVTRNGLITGNYLWDPIGDSVTIYEYDASTYPLWQIIP